MAATLHLLLGRTQQRLEHMQMRNKMRVGWKSASATFGIYDPENLELGNAVQKHRQTNGVLPSIAAIVKLPSVVTERTAYSTTHLLQHSSICVTSPFYRFQLFLGKGQNS